MLWAGEPKLVSDWTEWLLVDHPTHSCIDSEHCQWIGFINLSLEDDPSDLDPLRGVEEPILDVIELGLVIGGALSDLSVSPELT